MKKGWLVVFLLGLGCDFALAITKLNQALAPNGTVQSALFANGLNSDRIVYVADVDGVGQFDIFSVNVLNQAVADLNDGLIPGGDVISYEVSPDGLRVVFLADKNTDETVELFSVPVIGGIPLKLSLDFPAPDRDVLTFQISPDSQKVVYWANVDNVDVYDVYVNPIASANTINLTGGLLAVSERKITDDSLNLVFTARIIPQFFTELFTVSLNGGPIIKLCPDYMPGQNVFDFKFLSNTQLVYRAFQDSNQPELYQVDMDGGNLQKVSLPLPNGGVVFSNYEISPDGSNILYIASQVQPGEFNLISYRVADQTSTVLNGPLPLDCDVNNFVISPNTQTVVYRADQNLNDKLEIFGVPISGGMNTVLNGIMQNQADVYHQYQITTDNSRVIYRTAAILPNLDELFSSPLDGSQPPVRLNPDLIDGGDVESFILDGKQKRVFYLADQIMNNQYELFTVPQDGSAAAMKVNSTLVAGGNVVDFNFNDKNTRLYYLADQETDGQIELYTTVLVPPIITSPTEVTTMLGEPFNYIITAENPPFTGFHVDGLPDWATLVSSNQISGIPNLPLEYSMTLFVTNEAGFASTNLTVKVEVPILPPETNSTYFTGDFDGDGSPDLLAQKKQVVTLVRYLTNGTFSPDKTIELPSKKHRVVGANLIRGTNAIIFRKGTTLSALQVDSNFSSVATIGLGSLPDKKTKVRASGDINNDGLADILTQKGKTLGALLSPGYSFFPLGSSQKSLPPIVALLSGFNSETNAAKTLLMAKGKKLFTYDLPASLPLTNFSDAQPKTGPVLSKKYKIVGALPNATALDTNTPRIILQKGKKAGVISYGSTTLAEPILDTKPIGKIVGPK
jgi:dipeptidyl aminopeptidase/acylaminoacyl peptidase